MDVLLLSRLLKELIIDNDRIPLPGMGYFQTEPMPAYFSEDGKTIYPPSKRISFKGDERAAGDLVARYYAAGTGMDGKTAATEYFVAEKDGGIFAQAFGFEPVTLKPVKTAPATTSPEPATETPASTPTPTAAASPAGTEKPAQTETAPKPAEPTSTGGKKGHRILFIILGILAAMIIAAVILVELGRSGKLDHLIYSDEELELLEQHGM